MKDGEYGLGEGAAIQWYILGKHKYHGDFLPTDLEKKCKIMQIISYEMTTLRKSTGAFYYSEVVGPRFFKKAPAEADAIAKFKEDFDKDLDKLTAFIKANGGEYLTGEHYTLGDLNAFCFVSLVIHNKLYNLDKHPEVAKWYDNCANQKGWVETLQIADAFWAKAAGGQ